MNWRFWRKSEERPEEPQAPDFEWGAWVLRRKGKGGGYEFVFVERPEPQEPMKAAYVVARPLRILSDPFDIAPAFDMRYEQVRFGDTISLRALKKNVHTFKLRVREVVTDPKRVARRHWHQYMVKKREEQIIEDSRLFI